MALNVNIIGRDSEGNLQALKVNSEGNLDFGLYGKYGEAWIPVKVDSEGRPILASDVTVNAEGLVVDMGQIKQGPAGTEPWLVQLSGTIPEITTIINAVAVTEANAYVDDAGTLIPGTLIDKYVDWDLFVINTHDSAFRCSFIPVNLFNSTPRLVMRDGSVKAYSTGTTLGATAHHLIPAESYPIALGTIPAKAGDVEAVDTHPYKNYAGDLRLYLRSVSAPTKGAITVRLVGRLR
jgi:hypothetical protein